MALVKRHIGKVKFVNPSLVGRDAPAGEVIYRFYTGNEIEGRGDLIEANGFMRMHLISPTDCWVAAAYLEYVTDLIEVDDEPDEEEIPTEIWISMTQGGEQRRYILAEG